jgi:hypothetical protein
MQLVSDKDFAGQEHFYLPVLFMKIRSEAAQKAMDTRRIWRIHASATEGPAEEVYE